MNVLILMEKVFDRDKNFDPDPKQFMRLKYNMCNPNIKFVLFFFTFKFFILYKVLKS